MRLTEEQTADTQKKVKHFNFLFWANIINALFSLGVFSMMHAVFPLLVSILSLTTAWLCNKIAVSYEQLLEKGNTNVG